LKVPANPTKQVSIWTYVMDAFLKPTSLPGTNAMTSKEKTNTSENHQKYMKMRGRCKTCFRKLKGKFSPRDCKLENCELSKQSRIEILTFKDYKVKKFKIIEDLESNIIVPISNKGPNDMTDMFWNPPTQEWEERDAQWGMYNMC